MPDKVITVKLLAQTGQYTTQIAAAAKSNQSFAASVSQSAGTSARSVSNFSQAAAKFGKVVTLGVAGGLALSAKAAVDFESSFAGVRKTLDATPGQFATLRDQIRGLAQEIPIAHNELNRIAELGGQLGVSVGGVEEFTEVIAKLGVTTTLESDSAAQSLARLANILGISEKDYERVGSAIVDLGNNFATTEDQLLTFALRIAPVGGVIGLTADEVLGLATAFSSVGVPAERGGTAIQRTFIEMAEAVKTGGENLETFGKVAGRSGDEFRELFEQDAAQALNVFLQGLQDLDAAGGNVFAVLDNVGLGSQRTVQALLAASNATGLLSSALYTSEQAYAANVALNEEAALRFETTASKIELAKNRIYDLGISIGDGLLPFLGATAETLSDFIDGIDAMGPVGKIALALILGLTAGLVTANKVGKVIVRTFGLEVPAAFGTSRGAALAFQSALGLGLVAAITGITLLIADSGQKAKESAARVRDLTDAFNEIARGNDVDPIDTIIGQLSEDDKAILDDIGVSYRVFAEAVSGSGNALRIINDQLKINAESLGASMESIQLLGGAQDLLTQRTDEYNQSIQESADIIEQERLLSAMDRMGDIYGVAADQAASFGGSLDDLNPLLDDFGNELGETETALDRLNAAFDEFNDAIDTSLSFVDAVVALAEAEADLNEATEPTFDQMRKVQDAFLGVQRAAQQLGPNGVYPAIKSLQQMRDAGILTQDQFFEFLSILAQFIPIAGAISPAGNQVIGSLEAVGNAASLAGIPVGGFIGLLKQLDAAMYGSIRNAGSLAQALSAIQSTARAANTLGLLPGFGDQLVNALSIGGDLATRLASLLGGYQSIGSDIAGAIGTGIQSGGGGGSGGGTIEEVIEEELEDALQVARDQLDVLVNAIEATLGQEDAIRNLADAERELLELKEEQASLPDKIIAAEERLRRAREDAAKVTLDEKLAIQVAEENLARARLAFSQGRISQTELEIAERDLANAREAATEDTDDVRDAEQELEELRLRQEEIALDILDAERDLIDAKLDLIQAELDLIEAGRDYNAVGQEGIEIFKQWAEQVGLTTKEIEGLLKLAGDAGDQYGTTPIIGDDGFLNPGGGSGGNSGQNQYVVRSGDTLSKIAQQLGVTLAHLISLNSQVYNQSTGLSRNLDPNSIFPGDLLSYQFGGVVPGPFGKPRLALVHGGEEINTARDVRTMQRVTEQPILIENLHVQGVFDPTRPGEWNKIMKSVEQSLELNRRGRTA